MRPRVRFAPEARDDLLALYEYLVLAGGPDRAIAYVGRIERICLGLADFPLRGAARDDIRPGLRLLGFERRAVIGYDVTEAEVTILRILHGGRDIAGSF